MLTVGMLLAATELKTPGAAGTIIGSGGGGACAVEEAVLINCAAGTGVVTTLTRVALDSFTSLMLSTGGLCCGGGVSFTAGVTTGVVISGTSLIFWGVSTI